MRESEFWRTEGEIKETEAGSGWVPPFQGESTQAATRRGNGTRELGVSFSTLSVRLLNTSLHLPTEFFQKREKCSRLCIHCLELPPFLLCALLSLVFFFFDHAYCPLRLTVLWFQPRGRASKTLALLSLRSSRLQFQTRCQMLPVLGPANISHVTCRVPNGTGLCFCSSISSLSW